eukprot:1331670-Amorphochlora_amoeboformis.AAC.3
MSDRNCVTIAPWWQAQRLPSLPDVRKEKTKLWLAPGEEREAMWFPGVGGGGNETWVWVLDSDSSGGVEECLGLGFDRGRERMTFAR